MRPLAFLFAILLSLSGCVGLVLRQDGPAWRPTETWRPDPCDPATGPEISRNAPAADAFRGPVRDVVDAWTRALGERGRPTTPSETGPREPSPEPTGEGHWTWGTERGQFTYTFTSDPLAETLLYEAFQHWAGPSPRSIVEAALRASGLDPVDFEIVEQRPADDPSDYVKILVLHRLVGQTMAPPVVDAYFALRPGDQPNGRPHVRIELHPAHEVPAAAPLLDEDRLTEIADAYFACKGTPVESRDGPRYQVSGIRIAYDSVVSIVQPGLDRGLGCHETYGLLIDAVTGAIHGYEKTGFLCID